MSGSEDFARILEDPRYQTLVRRRRAFTWRLSAVILTAYLGFLLLVAFAKPLLAQPVAGGFTSVGIVLGIGLILLSVALTAIYVRRAATEYDPVVDALRAEQQP